jgi:hypothetical protein
VVVGEAKQDTIPTDWLFGNGGLKGFMRRRRGVISLLRETSEEDFVEFEMPVLIGRDGSLGLPILLGLEIDCVE